MRKNRPQSDPPRQGFTALEEIVLTVDPMFIGFIVTKLSLMYDTDKQGFNLVLEKFQENKDKPMDKLTISAIFKKKIIRDKKVNKVLTTILLLYWRNLRHNGGHMMQFVPTTKKPNQTEQDFKLFKEEYVETLKKLSELILVDWSFYRDNTKKQPIIDMMFDNMVERLKTECL